MYQRLGLTLKPEVLFWNTGSACDTPKPKFTLKMCHVMLYVVF